MAQSAQGGATLTLTETIRWECSRDTAANKSGVPLVFALCRYGAEAHLLHGSPIALLYDDDGDDLGADISYTNSIGEVQQSQSANTNWTPDLFAAVSREHSQRIVSINVSVVPPLPTVPSFVYSNRNIVRPANNAIIGTVTIPRRVIFRQRFLIPLVFYRKYAFFR